MSDITSKAELLRKIDASHSIPVPKKSKWKCIMFGGNPSFIFHPEEGKEPNRFHRKMQTLILGHKWVNTEQGNKFT